MSRLELSPGCLWWPGCLDRNQQEELLRRVEAVIHEAPLFTPHMPRTAQPLSVRITNCGPLGWVSDVKGYRYQDFHPETRRPWPELPAVLLNLWTRLSGYPHPPQACLVNWYEPDAHLGLHQDRNEEDFTAPVLSVSLGDTAVFRLGGTDRRASSRSIRLSSGDVLMLSGPARLAFHGIDRIVPGTSTLLPQAGRFNLTLRRVTRP